MKVKRIDAMNELNESGMIYDSRKSKSVTLSSAGKAYVKELLSRHGLSDRVDNGFDEVTDGKTMEHNKSRINHIP
jgi:Mn-dependent DtxR family transcriptional regulator